MPDLNLPLSVIDTDPDLFLPLIEEAGPDHQEEKPFAVVSLDLKKTTEHIFGFTSTQAIKLTRDFIFDTQNSVNRAAFKLASVLSKDLEMNRDLIFSNITKIPHRAPHHSLSQLNKRNIAKLMKYYNEQRVFKLLFSENLNHHAFLNDIRQMLITVEKSGYKNYKLPKKPKSLKEIHDTLTRICKKLEIPDYDLNQKEDILKLDNEKIDENLIIRVPKTHHDLVDLGEMLNFCIGNGYYSNEVLSQRCSIVGIFDKAKPLYGIQFTRYTISQAYGFGNQRIPKHILEKISDKLISAPELPDDFITVKHSFIQGYKYNDKDLYVMFNNGGIYLYEDVPHHVYDDFITAKSRGSYFSKYIRNSYSYERVG